MPPTSTPKSRHDRRRDGCGGFWSSTGALDEMVLELVGDPGRRTRESHPRARTQAASAQHVYRVRQADAERHPPVEIPLSAQSNGRHDAKDQAPPSRSYTELRAGASQPGQTYSQPYVTSTRRTRASRATAIRGQLPEQARAGDRPAPAHQRPALRRSPARAAASPAIPPPGAVGRNRGPQGARTRRPALA